MIDFLFAQRQVSLAFIIVMVMICFVAFYFTGRYFGKRATKQVCSHRSWDQVSNEELAS